MKVVEIRLEAEFHKLQSDWNALLRDSRSNTVFLTWDWIRSWWSCYGTPEQLYILAAYDDADVLRGIAPLRRLAFHKFGQTVSALCFLGDNSNDSDYLDFIIGTGYEEQVIEAFSSHLAPELKCGTVLVVNEIPNSSPNLTFLRDEANRRGVLWTEVDAACGSVSLPNSWEEYLAKLRPRFRTKVRSVLRHLESRSDVRFGFCTSLEQIRSMLPVLFDLHTRRWTNDGKPGVFGWPAKRDFYFAVSTRLLERGWLRFSWLEWNGHILACQYGFAYGDTYFHLQEGYEPSSEHWNLGIGLRAWSIREFLKEGLRAYDFLGGIGRHKSDWAAEAKQSKRITMSSSFKNVLFCRGPQWEARARESLNTLVPERILALRRTYLEQRSASARQGPGNTAGVESSTDWMRRAAASCYLHLRIPALARPLRDRYQLSKSPRNGGRPHISFERKTKPAARILYYHRINDDDDPFFPALSTALFEQQMQFVAKHYRVVSLADLLDHLEGDRCEEVVAITFDDGYRDNYENAFPILQRYGLPATIFLTTGSLDSGDPIWFEQLAHVLKETGKEFIDLDIDLPRRFWLRTHAERLQANGQIFGLLRALEDCDRQLWVQYIIRLLKPNGDPMRRDRMLKWDHVRVMNAHGIDFGGHTVTHPFLSRMPKEKATWEISACKSRIEQEVQRAVRHFAYPNGRQEDFSDWNKDIVRSAGYRAAVTTVWGMNHRSTDPMELRRGQPWEKNTALFAWKLDWYHLVNE